MGVYLWVEKAERTPTSDVLAYFPLDSTYQLNSYDGQKTLSKTGTVTFDSNCVYGSGAVLKCTLGANNAFTLFGWLNYDGNLSRMRYSSADNTNAGGWYGWSAFMANNTTDFTYNWQSNNNNASNYKTVPQGWHSIVIACGQSDVNNIYIDGELYQSLEKSNSIDKYYLVLEIGKMGKVGLSNIQRTATEALAFHEGTKADYGL